MPKSNDIQVCGQKLKTFLRTVLSKVDVRDDVAEALSHSLIDASLRGVDSHGVALFPHYIRAVEGGRINPSPEYRFEKKTLSTGLLDADHTFGHAAAMEGARCATQLAAEAGTGHVAIFNSSHFGAAATYALKIAQHDMIGMSFTNTDALVQSHGAKKAFFGNNPICVAIPCEGEEPMCLDMATSVLTFNKVKQLHQSGEEIPKGIGADEAGNETTDPGQMKILFPVGSYKGFGLSMVVEVLCSLLSGMPFGPHIPKMYEAPLSEKRTLGHFVMALRIDAFQDKALFKKRMAQMVREVRSQEPKDKTQAVQVAGDPEKAIARKRGKYGIPLPAAIFKALKDTGSKVGVDIERMVR